MSGTFVALGANLPHPVLGPPRAVLEQALASLARRGVAVTRRSRWYRSAPVPASDQPWFVNGVAAVSTALSADALLGQLHEVEAEFGRVRGTVNAARVLDLDLIDFRGAVSAAGEWPVLPHPRLHERAFVLLPLRELAPDWRHPASGQPIATLIAALPPEQRAAQMDDEAPSPPGA